MKNMKKGFTLIELLVVIAIIGMLSAVVLASLNVARGKGANAGIKQNMNSLRSQVEVYYDSSASGYDNVCDDAKIMEIRASMDLISGGTTVCNDDASAWAASSPLKVPDGPLDNLYWCVDSTGVGRGHIPTLDAATVCP